MNIRIQTRAAALCLLLSVQTAVALAQGQKPLVDVPIEIVGYEVFVPVKVAGKSTFMLLETGSPITVFTNEFAKSLDLKLGQEIALGGAGAGTTKGHLAKLPLLELQGEKAQGTPVVTMDLTDLQQKMGRPYAGLLANDFTSKYVMEIDYPHNRLRLWDPKTYKYEGSAKHLPLHKNSGHLQFEAELKIRDKQIPVTLTLDTGAATSLVLGTKFCEENSLPGDIRTIVPPGPSQGVGGKVDALTGRIEGFDVGGTHFSDPLTQFSRDKAGFFAGINHAGLIGNRLMKRYRVIIDRERNELMFELVDPSPQHADSSGMALIAADGFREVRVSGLLPGGPAAEAGILDGDRILEIDGKRVKASEMFKIRVMLEEPNVEHTILVFRDRADKAVKLRTRVLI